MNAYEKQCIQAEAIPHPAAADKSNTKFCSVLKHLYIEPGIIQDYHQLARFHYRCTKLGPIAGIWAIRYRTQGKQGLVRSADRQVVPVPAFQCEPVAVIVYTYPAPNLAVRNRITQNFFARPDKAAGVSLLNRHVRCISRVIVDPRWRNLGLASWLVGQTMPRLNIAMIESMALMGHFHPFLENAGMRQFIPPQNPKTEKLIAAMESLNIKRDIWYDPNKVQAKIDALSNKDTQLLNRRINAFLGRFGRRRHQSPGLERTAFILEHLAHPWTYFAWLNPAKPMKGLRFQPVGAGPRACPDTVQRVPL
jgi:GNAT superfamily N-acetyltransferase